jgi:hypothetical protein
MGISATNGAAVLHRVRSDVCVWLAEAVGLYRAVLADDDRARTSGDFRVYLADDAQEILLASGNASASVPSALGRGYLLRVAGNLCVGLVGLYALRLMVTPGGPPNWPIVAGLLVAFAVILGWPVLRRRISRDLR